jgi:glycosyltransferase involved in cell wall biosynthesis
VWLGRARLFAMTSRVEGLPMSMIEALAAGVPVVLPDVGDVTTLARHGENAWIVSPASVAGFGDAIRMLLGDADLHARLRQGCLDTARSFADEYSLAAAQAAWRPILAPACTAEGN